MTEITIDLNDYVKIMNNRLNETLNKAVQISISDSMNMIKDKWQLEAQKKLKSTRSQYLMGLGMDLDNLYNTNILSAEIFLKGTLPNMTEKGYSPFDMKIGFSKSNRKKITKNGGWYLTIPYRHSTPNSFMYGKPMPKNIYSQARKLSGKDRLSIQGGQGTSWTGYRHKSNIYDALTRIIQQNAKRTQSQYNTYRRVSNNSDLLSWKHRGYKGAKIAQSIIPYAKQIFEDNLKSNLLLNFI